MYAVNAMSWKIASEEHLSTTYVRASANLAGLRYLHLALGLVALFAARRRWPIFLCCAFDIRPKDVKNCAIPLLGKCSLSLGILTESVTRCNMY